MTRGGNCVRLQNRCTLWFVSSYTCLCPDRCTYDCRFSLCRFRLNFHLNNISIEEFCNLKHSAEPLLAGSPSSFRCFVAHGFGTLQLSNTRSQCSFTVFCKVVSIACFTLALSCGSENAAATVGAVRSCIHSAWSVAESHSTNLWFLLFFGRSTGPFRNCSTITGTAPAVTRPSAVVGFFARLNNTRPKPPAAPILYGWPWKSRISLTPTQ